MNQKDYAFLLTTHHGGLWFVSEILEHRLGYALRGHRDILENVKDLSTLKPPRLFSGHLTAFERMGSGIIDFEKIKKTYDFFNKDDGCLAIISIREPLAALVSAGRRAPSRLSGWIISEYVSIALDCEALDPLYFPIDLHLSLPDEERYNKHFELLTEFENRMGVDLGEDYKETWAREWRALNVTTDYCVHEFGDPKLKLKTAYVKGDVDYIKNAMPKEWEYLIEMREILQPFFENMGYKDLLWYDTNREDVKNIPHVKSECNFASTVLSKLYPKSVLSVDSYPHFTHRLSAQYETTSVHMRREAKKKESEYEKVIIGDASRLNIMEPNSFDAVVSLGSLEYVGLGYFGGQINYDMPEMAFSEMRRVLKPDGYLIFTLPITRSGINVVRKQPVITPVNHRIYSMEAISEQYCKGLVPISEKYYSLKTNDFCTKEDVTDNWQPEVVEFIYMGCWQK